eukprot:6202382-Pleurochrysis_carterae.AAC.1
MRLSVAARDANGAPCMAAPATLFDGAAYFHAQSGSLIGGGPAWVFPGPFTYELRVAPVESVSPTDAFELGVTLRTVHRFAWTALLDEPQHVLLSEQAEPSHSVFAYPMAPPTALAPRSHGAEDEAAAMAAVMQGIGMAGAGMAGAGGGVRPITGVWGAAPPLAPDFTTSGRPVSRADVGTDGVGSGIGRDVGSCSSRAHGSCGRSWNGAWGASGAWSGVASHAGGTGGGGSSRNGASPTALRPMRYAAGERWTAPHELRGACDSGRSCACDSGRSCACDSGRSCAAVPTVYMACAPGESPPLRSCGGASAALARTTQRRRQALRRAFEAFDLDGSHSLSTKEVFSALRGLGLKITKELVRRFARADRDHDSELDLDEFCELVALLQEQGVLPASSGGGGPNEQVADAAEVLEGKALFDQYDRDRSGFITRRELNSALTKLGIKTSTQEATEILRRFDADSDGKLDVHEFTQLLKQLREFTRGAERAADEQGADGRAEQRSSSHPPPSQHPERVSLHAAFRSFDARGVGEISSADVRSALVRASVDTTSTLATAILSDMARRPTVDLDTFTRIAHAILAHTAALAHDRTHDGTYDGRYTREHAHAHAPEHARAQAPPSAAYDAYLHAAGLP